VSHVLRSCYAGIYRNSLSHRSLTSSASSQEALGWHTWHAAPKQLLGQSEDQHLYVKVHATDAVIKLIIHLPLTATRLRSSYESEVIWLDDKLIERCYDGFCHKVLWPTLHYIVADGPKSNFSATYSYQEKSYEDYVKVNQAFADAIVNVVREGDVST
jgi:trehalose-6-phosphate synthase